MIYSARGGGWQDLHYNYAILPIRSVWGMNSWLFSIHGRKKGIEEAGIEVLEKMGSGERKTSSAFAFAFLFFLYSCSESRATFRYIGQTRQLGSITRQKNTCFGGFGGSRRVTWRRDQSLPYLERGANSFLFWVCTLGKPEVHGHSLALMRTSIPQIQPRHYNDRLLVHARANSIIKYFHFFVLWAI